jgi:site-specific recombinase XerD
MTIAVPEPQSTPGDDEVTALVAGWLTAQESVHTRLAYAKDVDPRIIPLFPDLFGGPKRAAPHKTPAILPWADWCRAAGIGPVDGVTRTAVNAYARKMEEAGLSAATRARKLAAISSWYRWLVWEDRIPFNPADVRRPKVDAHTSKTPGLTRDQALAMLRAADARPYRQGLRNAALLSVLLFTGIRVSEATRADIEDLGMDREHRVLWVTRKGGKQQPLPLPPAAWVRLTAYLASRDDVETLPAVSSEQAGPRPRRPLFLSARGNRTDEAEVYQMIRRLARAAGLPPELISRLGAHAMRHTAITLAFETGAQQPDIQNMAGHASANMTQVYNHSMGLLDRSPVYKIAAYLAEGAGQFTDEGG